MPTLTTLRKAKKLTIKQFADALGIGQTQAGHILHARDGDDYYYKHEAQVLALLGVTRQQYRDAVQATREDENRKWRVKHPPLTPAQHAAWEAQLKADADEIYAKMTPAERRRVHQDAMKLGIARDNRSPLDRMIDRAVGRE